MKSKFLSYLAFIEILPLPYFILHPLLFLLALLQIQYFLGRQSERF